VFNPGATGNVIRGNSIDASLGLGIDLGNDGVTPNDLGDADTGPNNFQNFPVIAMVTSGGTTKVVGSVDSTVATDITVDFYASSTCDPSGNGEGAKWLGSITTTSNTDAIAEIAAELPTMPNSTFVTATATTTAGTSEFSGCARRLVEWAVGDGGNGHLYEYVRTPGTWIDANVAAATRSLLKVPGHLVTITSAAENAFVTSLKGDGDLRAWIGLTDVVVEGVFIWVTGEPFEFSNWSAGEPNAANPGEDYVEIFASGGWNDISIGGDGFNQGYIVEYDFSPLTVAVPFRFASEP
jgi:hypothetical protein